VARKKISEHFTDGSQLQKCNSCKLVN